MRAYGVGDEFVSHFCALIDSNHRTFVLFQHCGRWLGIRLDCGAAVMMTAVALGVVLLRNTLAPGLAGGRHRGRLGSI